MGCIPIIAIMKDVKRRHRKTVDEVFSYVYLSYDHNCEDISNEDLFLNNYVSFHEDT